MDELVPRARMTTTPDSANGGLVVALAGELDMAGLDEVGPQLEDLLGREPQPVVIDLGALRFLDSSGIAALIRIANRFDPVEVRHAGPQVRRILTVLGLADRFGVDRA